MASDNPSLAVVLLRHCLRWTSLVDDTCLIDVLLAGHHFADVLFMTRPAKIKWANVQYTVFTPQVK